MAERALAYDPQFDINDAIDIRHNLQKESQFKLRTKHNLETALGERFNVELSQVDYKLVNDHLVNPDHYEPFVDVIKRGVEYRLQFGNPCDREREQAELLGFQRLEELITINDHRLTMNIIVISPRGDENSSYQHNFFDVYQKLGQKVIMTRYPSKSNLHEFWQAAQSLDPDLPKPLILTDDFFLSHPIQTAKSAGEIVTLLQKDQSAMPRTQFERLVKTCSPIIESYTRSPSGKTFNALLNFADSISRVRGLTPNSLDRGQTHFRVEEVIKVYGAMQARSVTTGCGLQSGFGSIVNSQLSMVSKAPFSVSEFANSSCPDCGGNENHFHCPGCRGQIESGRGITTCPHCHLTKDQAGSKC